MKERETEVIPTDNSVVDMGTKRGQKKVKKIKEEKMLFEAEDTIELGLMFPEEAYCCFIVEILVVYEVSVEF